MQRIRIKKKNIGRRESGCSRQLEEEMARYVKTMAPASGEFARETSAHVAEMLLRETEWKW